MPTMTYLIYHLIYRLLSRPRFAFCVPYRLRMGSHYSQILSDKQAWFIMIDTRLYNNRQFVR